jgi:hypothetical protein
VEFVEPPVLVDQVDYLVEFVDPAPGAREGPACAPVLHDRVDQVVEFMDASPAPGGAPGRIGFARRA